MAAHASNDTDTQANDLPILSGTFPRRRLLGAMLVGTAGMATGGLLPGGAAGAIRSGRGRAAARVRQPAPPGVLTAEQAKTTTPDGFLPNSIGGVFAASGPASFVLIAGPSQTAVTVSLTPSTLVAAGDSVLVGDVSKCNAGDRAFVATSFNPIGGRVASFVEVNAATYWAIVTGVRGNTLMCTTTDWGSARNSDIEIELMPMTATDNGLPAVGDGIYCVATKSTPQNPERIWARFLEVFPNPTWR